MRKEVMLTEAERDTMACALAIMLNAMKVYDGDSEHAEMNKITSLILISSIIKKFDLEEFMHDFLE